MSGLEGLDDDHGSAAAGAGLGEGRRFGVIGGVGVVGLGGRHGEQFAGTGDVAGAPAIGKEPVMADAVETGRQVSDKPQGGKPRGDQARRFGRFGLWGFDGGGVVAVRCEV